MKKKDIISLGIIIGGALFFAYIFFGSSLFDEESTEAVRRDGDGLRNFDLDIPDKPIEKYEDKITAYDAELAQEEQEAIQNKNRSNRTAPDQPMVNDLTELLSDEPATKSVTPIGNERKVKEKEKTIETHRSEPVARSKSEQKVVANQISSSHENQTETTAEVKRKRVRNYDPSFGDGELQNNVTNKAPASKRMISAIIHGNQMVKDGNRVTIRLLEDFEGLKCSLAQNTMLTGIARAYEQRLEVSFTVCSAEGKGETIIAYDYSDGLRGLYVEGLSSGQEVKKEAVQDAVAESANDLGIPIVDNVVRSASNKKLTSLSVSLESGRKLYLGLE